MPTARQFINTAIAAAHPNLKLLKPAEKMGNPDAEYDGFVQTVRTQIERGAEQGMYLESLDVWVATPNISPNPGDPLESDLESDLDNLVDDVTDTLRALRQVRWLRSVREMHPDGLHAYRIQVTAKTE